MLVDLVRRAPRAPTAADELRLAALRDACGACERAADGWHLTYQPQWFCAGQLRAALGGVGVVVVAAELGSTNRHIRRYKRLPCFLFAEYQRSGRGTYGRQWLALPASSIAMSAAFLAPARPMGLTVALGGALCAALAPYAALRFKWPNDILDSAGRKVAGILTEISDGRLIIGVGMNWDMPDLFARRIASMGAVGGGLAEQLRAPLSRQQAAILLGQSVADTVRVFALHGFGHFRAQAQQYHIVAVGEKLTFGEHKGKPFAGFTLSGALHPSP